MESSLKRPTTIAEKRDMNIPLAFALDEAFGPPLGFQSWLLQAMYYQTYYPSCRLCGRTTYPSQGCPKHKWNQNRG
jgi:hypothetical protein